MRNRLLALCLVIVSAVLTANAGGTATDFKSKVTVSAPSGQGKVYVESRGANGVTDVSQISEVTKTHEQTSSSTERHYYQCYTLYAAPDKGYAFKEWKNLTNGATVVGARYGNQNNGQFSTTDNPLYLWVTAESSSSPEATLEAVFTPAALSVISNNYGLGSASIDKVDNIVGDQVTLKAVYLTPHAQWQNAAYQNHSRSVTFDGWYDENGNCLSTEETYQLTIEKEGVIEARFSREFALKDDGNGNLRGYFRVSPPFSAKGEKKFLCVTGNFTPSINYSSGTDIYGAMQYNQVVGPVYGLSDSVYSDPGSVIYLTGTLDVANIGAVAAQTKVASNIVGEAQGVSTAQILKQASPWLETADNQGFYRLYLTDGITLQWTSKDNGNKDNVFVSADHLYLANNRNTGDFDIQPVDLDHIDTNYFGAFPAEDMTFDGAYWISMFTSFPYECYENDGVEAYVVKSVTDESGVKTATLTLLESGIVPPATPVILKCQGLTPKENRLIPLMPDDPRLEAAKSEAEGNMLTGNYGLWTSDKYTGRATYNGNKMRVFSVNSEGKLGFYKLSAVNDAMQELIPNRAYLDLDKLPTEMRSAPSFAIDFNDGLSAIPSLSTDSDFSDVDAEVEYYTIDGIKVTHPTKGKLYIRRQGSRAQKVIF